MKNLFIILIFLLLTSCGDSETPSHTPLVDELYHARPKQDAAKAIANKDYRFIAVHNHDLILPMNIKPCLLDKFGYRVLSNESLEYMSYDFQMYGALSVIYANWYNYEILSKLEEIKEFPC